MSITKSTIKSNSRNGTFYALQNIWLKAVKNIMKREKTLALNIFLHRKNEIARFVGVWWWTELKVLKKWDKS